MILSAFIYCYPAQQLLLLGLPASGTRPHKARRPLASGLAILGSEALTCPLLPTNTATRRRTTSIFGNVVLSTSRARFPHRRDDAVIYALSEIMQVGLCRSTAAIM